MNDEINAAREVTKTNTLRLETFRAPDLGFLGYVDEDRVTFYRASSRRHTVTSEFDVSAIKALPKVDIVYSYLDSSTAVVPALVASGVRGLVFAGTGPGSLATVQQGVVKTLLSIPAASRPILVRSSRVSSGRVMARDEYDRMGMIPGDNLNPQKARILLMIALTRTTDLHEIQQMFAEY
jgi:L-asparaginase